ncbi:MAG TPA: Rv3235 family protein [Jatrophihabitans sp.]|jgi:hypothetical protein|nr:Rv3235 family protein [Jatrophihabitans sp.]
MSMALQAQPVRAVVVRPAPRREPPFDDELHDAAPRHTPFDQVLPFERPRTRPPVWLPRPPRPRGLPEPGPWGRRLLVGMIETAAGRRPLHQLAALLSPSVSRGLGADFERAAQGGAAHWLHRAVIRSMRVAEPTDGIAEVCATVEAGPRVRAIALRLEEYQGRWRCTRLQLG